MELVRQTAGAREPSVSEATLPAAPTRLPAPLADGAFAPARSETAATGRLATLLEELPEAVMLVDDEGVVRYANGGVHDVYGVEPAHAVGRLLADVLTVPGLLLRLEKPDQFLEDTVLLLAAAGEPHEDVFRHADGSTFVRRSVPAGAEGRFGRVVITTNVTRLRRRNASFDPGPSEEASLALAAAGPLRPRPRLRLLQGGLSS